MNSGPKMGAPQAVEPVLKQVRVPYPNQSLQRPAQSIILSRTCREILNGLRVGGALCRPIPRSNHSERVNSHPDVFQPTISSAVLPALFER